MGQQGIQQLQSHRNQAAEQSFEQALIIYRQLQHQPGVGAAFIGLGETNLRLGKSARALELSQQAIAILSIPMVTVHSLSTHLAESTVTSIRKLPTLSPGLLSLTANSKTP